MKLKVCGMRDADNLTELLKLKPDYVGMIFYEKSPRFIVQRPEVNFEGTRKVGVFVNASTEYMVGIAETYELDLLQLHGKESISQVEDLKNRGFGLIKAFGVSDELPLMEIQPYLPYVDYLLFDTKTPQHGGSGVKFDWSVLETYDLDKPYFLSGGIDLEDITLIKQMKLKNLHAIDVNSRFELAPAVKDIEKIKTLKDSL